MQFIKQTPKQVNLRPYTCPSNEVNTTGDTGPTGPDHYIWQMGPTGTTGPTGVQGQSEPYPPFLNVLQEYPTETIGLNSPYIVPIHTSALPPGIYMVLFHARIATTNFSLTDLSIQYSGFQANYTSTRQFAPNVCNDLHQKCKK